MSTAVKQFSKRASIVAFALVLIGSGMMPAQAAVPGAKCTKVNAKVKIGGENFVCADNPNTKSKAIVWVWRDCLLANTAYLKGIQSQDNLIATANQTIDMLKADIEKLKVDIAAQEPEAKTWDAKAADYRAKAAEETAKAAELKASAAKGGVTTVPSTFKRNLQLALFDKKLTNDEVITLANAWSTTIDKVQYFIDFISAEDRLAAAKSYETGAKNADRKAASLRSTNLIDIKERQIKSAETNIRLAKSQVASLKQTQTTACSVKVWKAIS